MTAGITEKKRFGIRASVTETSDDNIDRAGLLGKPGPGFVDNPGENGHYEIYNVKLPCRPDQVEGNPTGLRKAGYGRHSFDVRPGL